MAKVGWSVAGHRVELQQELGLTSSVFLDGVKLPDRIRNAGGEVNIPIGEITLKLRRTAGLVAPNNELSRDGQVIPPSPSHLSSTAVPAGAVCSAHGQGATLACARCGTFCCKACAAVDLTHCQACLGRAQGSLAKEKAALMYAAPALGFVAIGGLIGGAIGGGAGYLAVAYAKGDHPTWKKMLVAGGIYFAALVLTLFIAGAISLALER